MSDRPPRGLPRINARRRLVPALLVALAAGAPAHAEDGATITARVLDSAGEDRGFVALTELPHGIILQADLSGLAPGKHAFHLHETARCEAPDFTSAGGHFAPRDRSHGYLSGSGHHAGDLPNQIVDADGELLVSLYAAELSLRAGANALLDEDGSALIIHQGRDDYASQPSGAAGPRVACAALAPGLLSAAHGD